MTSRVNNTGEFESGVRMEIGPVVIEIELVTGDSDITTDRGDNKVVE